MSSLTRRVVFVLSFCFAIGASTAWAQPMGSIAGVATNQNAQPMANAVVQLRNAQGQVLGSGTTNAAGEYVFSGVPAGTYTVEVVNEKGEPIGTSSPVTVAADQAVTGVGITVSVVAAAAAGGASSLLAIVLALLGAAGVAGAGAVGIAASPSS